MARLVLVLLVPLALSNALHYGPRNVNHSIAIVGGGPTGIYMAMLLKEKGFKNITIYEMRDDIGAGSESILQRGTRFYESFMFPKTSTFFLKIASKYLTEQVDYFEAPEPMLWSRINGGNLTEMSILDYLMEYGKEMHGAAYNATLYKEQLVGDMDRYISMFQSMFPSGLEYAMLSNPSWPDRMTKLAGSVTDYLSGYNMLSLKPIFLLRLTLYGYGHPNDVPALTGLMHVPATIMNLYKKSVNTGVLSSDLGDYVIKSGYNSLFSQILSQEGINIMNNKKVDRIMRSDFRHDATMTLRWRNSDGSTQMKMFDFLIWVPNLFYAIKSLSWNRGPSNMGYSTYEYQNFLRIMSTTYKNTAVFDSINITLGSSPINIFIDQLNQKGNGIAILFDTYAIQQQYNSSYYQSPDAPFNADNSPFRTMAAVYYTMGASSNANLGIHFQNIMNNLMPKNVSYNLPPLSRKVNLHYRLRDVRNNMLMRIKEMQGLYAMWYAGDSVTEGPLQSQLAYNEYLVQNMKEFMKDGENGGNNGGSVGGGGGGNVIN